MSLFANNLLILWNAGRICPYWLSVKQMKLIWIRDWKTECPGTVLKSSRFIFLNIYFFI